MTTVPDRLVLEGVPRVHFYEGGPRCPEDIPFPSVMRALMEYFGERDLGCRSSCRLQPGYSTTCSYSFFVGVSGVASFLSWKPGWEGDNVEIMYMSDDPRAPFDRAFRATGYEYQVVGVEEGRDNEVFFRQRIIESIQEGRPVLAFGPIGPPESAIITGYDESGGVLIGWSFFQNIPEFNAGVEFEPSGQFRKRGWFDYQPGFSFILIGQKKPKPPLSETYRQALEWMVQVTRTPVTFGDRQNGLAAYTAWADQLLRDGDFPNDEAVLRQRHGVHDNVVGMVAEARAYGAQFLAGMADHIDTHIHRDMVEPLLHAAACYAGEHALMWNLWDLAGGIGNPDAYRHFADPAVRRQMVPILEQARDRDAQAADHIEVALGRGQDVLR
jgi:hypothetical protein